MENYNWAILGLGTIADMFAEALVTIEPGTLLGVASRELPKAKRFATRYAAQRAYGSYQAMLEDPEVEIVYIATPQSLHFSQAKMCLAAGKHVLVEKPLTINAEQCRQLIALAKSKGLVLQEALWSRFMPCFQQIKIWLDEGRIGELQYISSDIGFAFGEEQDHRLHDPLLGGGALLDLGVYSVTLSQMLMQEHPSDIKAMASFGGRLVDENTQVLMRYPSGRFAQFSCTITAQASNTMTLMGTHGRISLPSCFWNGTQARLYQGDAIAEEIAFPHKVNGFEFQIEETMRCISQRKLYSDFMPHGDSLAVMQTLDEIRRQIGLKFSHLLGHN